MKPIDIIVWGENHHEKVDEYVREIYPEGMHEAIAAGLRSVLGESARITTATLDDPEHGLSEERLASADVVTWWGHKRHGDVDDEVVDRLHRHVLDGLGLVVLHSGHYSKIFRRLMGTSCTLNWRATGDEELVWTVEPDHPVAQGVPHPIRIPAQEMYGERFDIPAPDELVFLSSFSGGEVFRSGCTFRRGRGTVFYFSPGDQHFPVYRHPDVLRVVANASGYVAGRRHGEELRNRRIDTREDWNL
ncbi:ThuA domain-containing protein [Phycicoccus sp. BSK3Z-2]|uniref:ThuA domain-containing protein n=1 Tax=Phycicoccus avicenniae TaxID=2828860 RepID=A0A941I1D2_9MICO|nr:ThuA domain-containing protein [Phycicoccus avicenniae]MBR7744800.1 ThuA domain-containing protein [Phycicoccus avicenniae]